MNSPAFETPATTIPEILKESGPVVSISTSVGTIRIKLRSSYAPVTCESFAELVEEGFYDGLLIHHVEPNSLIQTGDPNTQEEDESLWGIGGPGFTLPLETGLTHAAGSVAMVSFSENEDEADPQCNGSQFYITLREMPIYDHVRTVFGHVVEGLDVVEAISRQPRHGTFRPERPIEITQAVVESES